MSQEFSNLQTGGHQPGLTGPDALIGIQQTSGTDQTVAAPTSKDSIEKAAELVAALYLPPMSNPQLIPPDSNLVVVIGQLEMDKICLNILDSWSKSLQKIAEQTKEDERLKELNPILREVHVTASLFLAVASIFIRAIFGTKVADAIQKTSKDNGIEQRYAAQLNQWAAAGTLQGYLMTIVDTLPSAGNLSEAQKNILSKQLQVMLLSSALAGLYKVQTNWITSEEFFNLLADPSFLKNSNAIGLSALIVKTLAELPEVDRSRMTRTLTIFMNSNPELPTLFDLGQTAGVQLSILNSSRS